MDQSSPEQSSSGAIEVSFPVIPPVAVSPMLQPIPDNPQVDALAFRPGTVREPAIGNIITSSHPGLGQAAYASFAIPGGTSATFSFTLTDNLNRTQHAIADSSIYIGVVSQATQWPNATYGMATMPRYSEYSFGDSDNANVVYKMTVRNNFVADVPVIAACKFRIIVNNTLSFEQSNAGFDGHRDTKTGSEAAGGFGGGF